MKYRLLSLTTLFLVIQSSAFAAPLITTKESQLPNAQGELKTRGISRGPGIRIISPEAEVKSPFDLKVQFESRGGNKIDPASVKVTYLKSPLVDLTSRVKPAIKESGIDFSKAEAPPGEHQVKITVKDADGRETSSVITINVIK
jgi:hypothetical protein